MSVYTNKNMNNLNYNFLNENYNVRGSECVKRKIAHREKSADPRSRYLLSKNDIMIQK